MHVCLLFFTQLSIYSSTVKIVQRTSKVKLTSRLLDHLGLQELERAQGTSLSSPLHNQRWINLVVIHSKVIVPRHQRTSVPEHHPPPMKRSIDRHDLACKHINIDEQRPDPSRSTKKTLTKSHEIHRRQIFTRLMTM